MNEHRAQPDLLSPQAVLSRTAHDLAAKYVGVFSAQTVERYVFESYTALRRTAKVHTHLTSLAARFAADRLTALAQSSGALAKDVPEVLFVCVHNAGRSQMAAGFLSHLAGDAIEVRSAGSAPADTINSAAVEAMAELGIDISAQTPKILTTDAVQDSDVVITMGCGDTCPIFPGKSYRDWVLDDPAGQGIDAVRPIRDEIKTRVQALISELTAPSVSR